MESNQHLLGCSGDDSASHIDQKTTEKISRAYKAFVSENNIPEIIGILLEDEINVHYCIVTDCTALLKTDMTLADALFFHSAEALEVLDRALDTICREVYVSHALKLRMRLKPNLHARMKNIPICPELWRERVPKSKDIGKFLAVEGTVIRTSSVKLLEFEKELTCSKCQCSFMLKADFEQHYRIPTPSRCPVRASCNSKKFIMAASDSTCAGRKCKDFQEIKIQEQMRRLAMGTIPRTITVVLEDDLVDGCKAGDDVVIYGALKCRWQQLQQGKTCNIELVMKANYIEVRNEQLLGASVKEEMQNDFECFWAAHSDTPMVARNHILASLCPQIYGLYVVKLAVALVVAGGVPKTDSSGSRVRGEAHLLLVGDPGTGKSQFLKYASKITPRSVLTTGIGSTSAGLTVTAIRDGPHWTLEAGALVLADGGICCIDEFSSIRENDRGAIHEAMEQQTVSVAKAGLVCKLNTRTSVLAATNPKLGKYDESSSIDLNVAIASPLLSRFDLVLVLLDAKNELWDSVVADYVLAGKDVRNNNNVGRQKLWTMDQMQAYFCCVKQINPILTPLANKILSEYYRCHRRSDFRNASRTTIRLLESLIRIAEAHARLMYHQSVEVSDAVAAITVMESSMQGSSLLPTGSVLHSCFPEDPEKEYKMHAQVVLNRLGLDDILQEEVTKTPVRASVFCQMKPFIPPESPFESKVLTGLSQLPSKSVEEYRVATDYALKDPSRVASSFTDLSFTDFEKSVNQHQLSSTEFSHADTRTSTQNFPQEKLRKIHPPKGKTRNLETPFTQNFQTKKCPLKTVSPVTSSLVESPKLDFRSRLQHFKHVTPDSSPGEIQLTGVKSHGNSEQNTSANTIRSMMNFTIENDTGLFNGEKSLEPAKFGPLLQHSSAGVHSEHLGLSLEVNKPQRGSSSLTAKQSIFSLNASAVEEICEELALNTDEGRFRNSSFEGISNSQFAIPSTVEQEDSLDESAKKGNENKPPDSDSCLPASELFRIDEDEFEKCFAGEDDSLDFNADWSGSQDNILHGLRRTFRL